MTYIEIKDWNVKLDMTETYRMKILPTEKFLNILKDKRAEWQKNSKISILCYCLV